MNLIVVIQLVSYLDSGLFLILIIYKVELESTNFIKLESKSICDRPIFIKNWVAMISNLIRFFSHPYRATYLKPSSLRLWINKAVIFNGLPNFPHINEGRNSHATQEEECASVSLNGFFLKLLHFQHLCLTPIIMAFNRALG